MHDSLASIISGDVVRGQGGNRTVGTISLDQSCVRRCPGGLDVEFD